MSKRRVLQVPMDGDLYQRFKEHSREMGFTSSQEYIRFWATAETKENLSRQDMSQPKVQALRYVELVLARDGSHFQNMGQALEFIGKHIRHAGAYKRLKRDGVSTLLYRNPDR